LADLQHKSHDTLQQHFKCYSHQNQTHQPPNGDHKAFTQHALNALGQNQHQGKHGHGHAKGSYRFPAALGGLRDQ
jgi:hypothetical protein